MSSARAIGLFILLRKYTLKHFDRLPVVRCFDISFFHSFFHALIRSFTINNHSVAVHKLARIARLFRCLKCFVRKRKERTKTTLCRLKGRWFGFS